MGDTPTGAAEYEVGGNPPPGASTYNAGFQLTHGDIVAMSGDFFDPRDHIRVLGVKLPNPDSLFRLAKVPSSGPGTSVGTRDEIVACLYRINKSDPRFAPGGKWHFLASVFEDDASKAVRDSVNERYLKLASRNIEHFVDPTGSGDSADGPLGSSAHASYRSLHKAAIVEAWEAGAHGRPIDMPKAREAAAHHFLTDAFAAGHLRTPRTSIREHWAAIYPNFWINLKKKIAHDMAIHINAEQTNVATLWANVMELYADILAKVEEKSASKPPLGFDNLVALTAHDLDNEVGLMVTNDFGEQWRTYGDSYLGEGVQPPLRDSPTEAPAHAAVVEGVADIEAAYEMGARALSFMTDAGIYSAVKGRLGASGIARDKFEPEKYLPRLDPLQETSTQAWNFSDVDELWGAPIRDDLPDRTYGAELTASLRDGELNEQLNDMAEEMELTPAIEGTEGIPIVRDVLGMLDVKQAYLQGFLRPLIDQPLIGLRSIIDFNPSLGQASWNTDDAAREEIGAMGEQEKAGLTLNQRADRIKALVEGTFNVVDEDDGELVIEMFTTASPSDRAQLYRLVEGHAWTGNWIHGVFVSDDEIWNALYHSQLTRLRTIINTR